MIDYDQTWVQKDYKLLCLWFNLTNDLLNFCLQLSCLKSRLLHHHIIICYFVCRNKTWRCRKTFGCLFQQHWCGRAPFSWNENEKKKKRTKKPCLFCPKNAEMRKKDRYGWFKVSDQVFVSQQGVSANHCCSQMINKETSQMEGILWGQDHQAAGHRHTL